MPSPDSHSLKEAVVTKCGHIRSGGFSVGTLATQIWHIASVTTADEAGEGKQRGLPLGCLVGISDCRYQLPRPHGEGES